MINIHDPDYLSKIEREFGWRGCDWCMKMQSTTLYESNMRICKKCILDGVGPWYDRCKP